MSFSAILGTAGTGKTTKVRQIQADARLAGHAQSTVLLATTGIAAVNLGDATTINSFLKYFDTRSLQDLYVSGRLQMTLRKYRQAGVRHLFLDEVSMLDKDQLTILTEAIKEVNDQTDARGQFEESILAEQAELAEQEILGGAEDELSLTVVGDFCQLPPVKADYAFESPSWREYEANTEILTTIHRQADPEFIAALAAVRQGRAQEALAYFEPHLAGNRTDLHFDGPTVLAKNDAVDRFNYLRQANLTTPPVTFPARREGEANSEWKLIPEQLVLKPGDRVMILANRMDGDELIYANGDIGTFREKTEHGWAIVTLDRTGADTLVTRITRHRTIPLESGRRKELKESGQQEKIAPDGKHEITGSIDYMPIRLAYATTCHKAQGLTFDRVQINLLDHFWKMPGMLYVGLSRARNMAGLKLIGTPRGFLNACTMDPRVRRWV